MKIGIDARMFSNSFTGIGRYNFELTKRLFELRPDREWVIFMNEPEYSRFHFPNHVRKVLVDAPHYSFGEQWKFWKILNHKSCDLVHFTHFNAPILYTGKFVTTIHDTTISFYPGKKMNTWWRKFAYNKVINHSVHQAQKIITVTDHTKHDLQKLFNVSPQKIETIWNGIGSEFQKISENEKQEIRAKFDLPKIFLLYTGNWREHKNLPRLIESFSLVIRQFEKSQKFQNFQNVVLVITGKKDPYYPEVLQTVEKLSLQERVRFVGLVSETDLLQLYAAAWMYVFPSLYEGFGLPPLEAMKSQTPAVASHISCIPEVCGEAVHYFNPHDTNDMAHNMTYILTNPKRRKELIQKGIQRVKLFSWDTCAKETLKVYDSVLQCHL
jgi:glycosyltransferase involved in cell wall biosynthesis